MKWNSARYAIEKSTLSSFSNFIEIFYDDTYIGYRNVVPKSVGTIPNVLVRKKTVLSNEQVEGIFNYLVNDLKDYQIACWFALAISSGSRFAELLRFTTDNISEDNTAFDDIFLETLKPIKTKGRTKTGKMLIKYIIKDIFWKYYQLWLPEREKILIKNNKIHNSIFIKSNGEPAEESTARGWVDKIEKYLSVPFYPHCCRHYCASYLVKAGLPYELIKELFGWDNILMCSLYNDILAKDRNWPELSNLKEVLKGVK
jgi:integrase